MATQLRTSELEDSSGIVDDAAALRERMQRDGYLFFRGLLEGDAVARARADVLEVCGRHGWLQENADPDDARVVVDRPHRWEDPEFQAVYDDVIALESFNRLPHSEALVSALTNLIGEPVLVWPKKIAFLIFPVAPEITTPPHQDQPLLEGVADNYKTWIPIGHCPRELGGVAVLPGSHRGGLRSHFYDPGPDGLAIDEAELEGEWLTTDYRPGDVLVFHILTVHRALENRTQDTLRLSMHCRTQGVSTPLPASALKPSGGRVSWDDLYSGWQGADLQRYWEGLPLDVVPLDPAADADRLPEALSRALDGDDSAHKLLQIMYERGPNATKIDALLAVAGQANRPR